MSKLVGDVFYIEREMPSNCTLCGRFRELRPYGENGSWICFQCAMKNEERTKLEFGKIVANVRKVVRRTSGDN